MGWNARKFFPWVIIIFFVTSSVCVKFTAAQSAPFVVGIDTNPPKLDPQDQYDSESSKLINQVCEGLYRYNYSSPEMEAIPQLATAIGHFEGNNNIGYNYTVSLRSDVTYHDGSKFNASAVKWTFDRIQYFSYGLYEDGFLVAKSIVSMESYSLFAFSGIPILNHTVIESEFVIRFVLNTAPGFFERLLAFMATQIMLPDEDYARGEKFAHFLDLNDDLIGTGPFELVEYVYDNQVVFKSYEGYYLPRPEEYIKNMIYQIIHDDKVRSLAIFDYEIHWGSVISIYDEEFEHDPNLFQVETKSNIVFYIQMNMVNMPQEVRKASAFAYNYSYLHEDRFGNSLLYLHTAVPDGMLYHHEGFADEPYTNLTYARELILSCPELTSNITASGLTISTSSEEWRLVADSPTPLAWYNFTSFYPGLENHYSQLAANMKDIGIRIDFIPYYQWSEDGWVSPENWWLDKENLHRLCYSFRGWGPDYNDPIDMIAPLYKSDGNGNMFLLNNSTLDDLLNQTYFSANFTTPTREDIFHDIQEKIVTELVPSFYLYQRVGSISFNRLYVDEDSVSDMKNAFGDYYWFHVAFFPPYRGSSFDSVLAIILYVLLGLGVTATVFFFIALGIDVLKKIRRKKG